MANRKSIINSPQKKQRSYRDLTKSEAYRVNSALSAAANLGKHGETTDGDSYLEALKASTIQNQRDTSTSELNEETEIQSKSEILKQSVTSTSKLNEESETESDFESAKGVKSDLFTISIDRENRHRLETALKLLAFVEGEDGSDYNSDFSLSSNWILNSANQNDKTSTPRVQALKNRASKNH